MKAVGSDGTRVGWWFVAAGVLVTARAAIALTSPSYWSPVSFVDYSAVVGTTLAWLVAAVAIVLLAQRPPLRRARLVLIVAAVGTAISAVGNLLEDYFDVPFGGDLFVWGGLVGAIGLVLGSVLTLTVKDRLRWAGVFLLGFIAGGVFPDDGGEFLSGVSLLALGGWIVISYRGTKQAVPK